MLDTEDGLALCLARDGDMQRFTINETPDNFSIEWTASYQIEGDAFITLDRSGRMRTIFGYPVKAILQVARMS